MSDDHGAIAETDSRPRKTADNRPAGKTQAAAPCDRQADRPRELGGPKGLEPTRYGDWERNGRCSDF